MTAATVVTPERIAELKAQGVIVEDMAEEHGPDFKGQFRWVLMSKSEGMIDFQDHDVSYSEADAWGLAAERFTSAP